MHTDAWHEIEGVVHYRLVELDSSIWHAIESLRGNKLVRIEGYPLLFVSKTDYAKLWPESPIVMMEKGYTIKAKLRSKTRMFGGITKAKVIATEILHESPLVSK